MYPIPIGGAVGLGAHDEPGNRKWPWCHLVLPPQGVVWGQRKKSATLGPQGNLLFLSPPLTWSQVSWVLWEHHGGEARKGESCALGEKIGVKWHYLLLTTWPSPPNTKSKWEGKNKTQVFFSFLFSFPREAEPLQALFAPKGRQNGEAYLFPTQRYFCKVPMPGQQIYHWN